MNIKLKPLVKENWKDFENLMGEKGGCGGCWCMTFRIPSREFEENKFEGNKKLMKELVHTKRPTGLIGYIDEEPVGWIALAPREDYLKIEKSRSLKRIDDKPVWSMTCFYVKKEYRRKGVSGRLIQLVQAYAKKQKIKVLEAYPVVPYAEKVSPPFLWTGVLSSFINNGFKIVRQNGKSKAMVRYEL